MAYPLPGTKKIASVLVVLGAGGLLVACGNAADTKPTNPPAAPSPTASPTDPATAPGVEYDISRVDGVKNGFPPGFTVSAYPAKTVSQPDHDSSRITALTEARIVPPKCRAVVLPSYAVPSAGAQAAGVNARGDRGSIDVIALRSPEPVTVGEKPEGCGLGLVISGSPDVAGPAEQIDAPTITGATTTGIKLSPEDRNPEYVFTARLDDRTAVVVMGNTDAQLNPERLMADLMTKATAAVVNR